MLIFIINHNNLFCKNKINTPHEIKKKKFKNVLKQKSSLTINIYTSKI